jgi:hypothetical protein
MLTVSEGVMVGVQANPLAILVDPSREDGVERIMEALSVSHILTSQVAAPRRLDVNMGLARHLGPHKRCDSSRRYPVDGDRRGRRDRFLRYGLHENRRLW